MATKILSNYLKYWLVYSYMESQVTGELMWYAHEPGMEANETRLGATGL